MFEFESDFKNNVGVGVETIFRRLHSSDNNKNNKIYNNQKQ